MDLREVKISKSTDRHPWELARIKVIKGLINRFFPAFKNKSTQVLDIGCGDTWLIEQLSLTYEKSSYTAVDIAFTDELLADYRKRLDSSTFSVYKTLDEAFSNNSTKIDLILLLDVIEHIDDDIAFLKWVQQFSTNITEDTLFLITVPAYQSLFCKHDEFLGHFRRYTNETLKKHISRAGLESLHIGYFFSSLLPFRWIISTIEKLGLSKKEAKGIGDWKSKPTDKLIKSMLVADYKLSAFISKAGIKLPGLSNYIICKKKLQ